LQGGEYQEGEEGDISGANFLDGRVTLLAGDCLEILAALPESSVDSVVTDPPYELGFMGKKWDGTGIANRADLWTQVLRVLRPGGHLVAFSGTRTYHRMACAIEDAGFEIRDQIGWAYGSGFPKSHDVSKGIDKAAGAEREVLGTRDPRGTFDGRVRGSAAINTNWRAGEGRDDVRDLSKQAITAPSTDAAKQWQGWGTALKPAWEPICLARKPLSGTVAANVLEHGVGALNIDGCRVETADSNFERPAIYNGEHEGWQRPWKSDAEALGARQTRKDESAAKATTLGRWPANLIHDGSEDVVAAFPETNTVNGRPNCSGKSYGHDNRQIYGAGAGVVYDGGYLDSGSAARFFYTAKADAEDRLGSKHPTVKPLDLMQWLVRLVTPKGGTVLDPFAGTGTTGEAAWREGMRAILIEREAEYQVDIARRMELATQPTKRAAVAASKNQLERPEDLPLFNMLEAK
jgi:DNA modification methylase